MFGVLMTLTIIVAIFLIVLVLLQPGKGDLSATFGGLSSQFGSMFGMQRTVDFMSKLTRWIAIGILVLIVLINRFFVFGGKTETPQTAKPMTEGAKVPASTMAPPPVEAPKGK